MRAARSIVLSLPLWWFLVTLLEILIPLSGFAASRGDPFEWVMNLLDLFVPYGIWNATQALATSQTAVWHVVSFFTVLAVGEFFGRRLAHTPSRKILYNLGILFLWTAAVELVVWGKPCSVMTWIDGRGCRPF